MMSMADKQKLSPEQYRQLLVASEARFRNIIEKNGDGIIIIDKNGVICFLNRAAETLLDRNRDQLLGKLFGFPLVASENTELDIIQNGQVIAIVEMRVVETEWDGEPVYLASLRDVTQRKRVGEALRFQAQLLDAVEQAVIAADLETRITYWNRFAEQLYGWPAEEVLGKNMLDIILARGIRNEEAEMIAGVKRGQSWSGTLLMQRRDGPTFPSQAVFSPVYDAEETLIGIVSVSADITRRKQVELELRRYGRRLEILRKIDQAVLSAHSSGSIARAALSHLQPLIPWQQANVVIFDLKAATVQVLAAQSQQEETPLEMASRQMPLSDYYIAQELKRGHVHKVEDIATLAKPSPAEKALYQAGVRSYISVPLIAQGEVIGALNLGAASAGLFSEDQISIAREVANSLAVAVQNARLHEQTEQDAKTKTVLLNEVNHRVKNNLTAIIGLLHLQQQHLGRLKDKAAYEAALKDLIDWVRGLATAHNLFSAQHWTPVLLSELAGQVIRAALQRLPPHRRMAVEVPPASVWVTPDQAHNLALVLAELATNTIKHGLAGQEAAQISVRSIDLGQTVRLEYRDNGPGYPEKLLQPDSCLDSVGLNLIKNIVQKNLQGDLRLQNDEGAVTIVEFKGTAAGEAKDNLDSFRDRK